MSIEACSVLDTVLIKVASRCNINCSYCYVYHMGDDNWSRLEKLMSKETIDAVCNALKELTQSQERYFSIVLHGGEPLLLGATRLEYLLSKLREVVSLNYPISIQTNGILITKEILDICFKYRTSVAVSIDGPKHVNDKYRITHKGYGTFEDVLKGINELRSHADSSFLYAGLLAVIDPSSHPTEVYSFFKELSPPSVDFLYKDGNHSNIPPGKSAVDSTEYGSWMVGLLETYLSDLNPVPIRVLDDMLKVLLGGMVSKEGLGITDFGIVIIDTDGVITKNDTLKSSYKGADRFEEPFDIKEGELLELLNSEEFNRYREMQRPTSLKCLECPVLNICGGGMTLHRWRNENGFDNPSVYCADQLLLINRMQEELAKFKFQHE